MSKVITLIAFLAIISVSLIMALASSGAPASHPCDALCQDHNQYLQDESDAVQEYRP